MCIFAVLFRLFSLAFLVIALLFSPLEPVDLFRL